MCIRDRLLSEHPGLVLLDVSLPDGNGFDFYSERLEKEKTPVIFLTARDVYKRQDIYGRLQKNF